MANILLADAKRSLKRLGKTLVGHVLHRASTYEAAKEHFRNNQIDLIICEIDFDEFRMIEFLLAVKKDPAKRDIPFVCWQSTPSSISDECIDDAMHAAKLLGASLCLSHNSLRQMSNAELTRELMGCLQDAPKEVPQEHLIEKRTSTLDHRN